jgi:hypothetical protein
MFFYVILLVVLFINYFFYVETNNVINHPYNYLEDTKGSKLYYLIGLKYEKFTKKSFNLSKYKNSLISSFFNEMSNNNICQKYSDILNLDTKNATKSLDLLKIEHFNKNLEKFSVNKNAKVASRKPFINNVNLFLFEMIYTVILNMVKNTIGGDKKHSIKFFPMVLTLFLFVLFSNILGLIPYSSTLTAYIIITLSLSIMVMFACTFYAFQVHGSDFIGFFLPSGCPG